MPFSFLIDAGDGLIRETWTGSVDAEQLQESCRQEWAHPQYRQGMPLISDFRNAEGTLSADDVVQFASWFTCEDKPVRHAIVVSRQIELDMASIYSMIADGSGDPRSETQIFFSYTAAESWVRGRLRDQVQDGCLTGESAE